MTHQADDLKRIPLARALYDFDDVKQGEIKLSCGDVIYIMKQVDNNWLKGVNLSQPDEPVGNFPKAFVSDIVLPCFMENDKLLLSTSAFQTDVAGDLNFDANEVIILNSFIDENWCKGSVGKESGIFPIAFTKDIHSTIKTLQLTEAVNHDYNATINPRNPIAMAEAVVDFDARFDDEISFKDGEVVSIFDHLEPPFVLASSQSDPSKVGRASLEYLYVTEGKENIKFRVEETKLVSKFDWWKEPEAELELMEKNKQELPASVVPSFEEQTAPLTEEDNANDNFDPAWPESSRTESPITSQGFYVNAEEHQSFGSRDDIKRTSMSSSSSVPPPPLPSTLPPRSMSRLSSSSSLMFLLNADDAAPGRFSEVDQDDSSELNANSNSNNNNNDDNTDEDDEHVKETACSNDPAGNERTTELWNDGSKLIPCFAEERSPGTPTKHEDGSKSSVDSSLVESPHDVSFDVNSNRVFYVAKFQNNRDDHEPKVKSPQRPPKPVKPKLSPGLKPAEGPIEGRPKSLEVIYKKKIKPSNLPPVPAKPKLKMESRSVRDDREAVPPKTFPKRRSVFYIDSNMDGERTEALTRLEISEGQREDTRTTQTSQWNETPQESSPMEPEEGKKPPVPCRPQCRATPQGNLSGSGALMTGGLDPDRLLSTPPKAKPVSTRFAPSKPVDRRSVDRISGSVEESEENVNRCILEDIERRIAETEQDLEKCIMEQSAILNEKYERSEISKEAEEELKFYQANILGLTDELTKLRAILGELRDDPLDSNDLSPSAAPSLSPPRRHVDDEIVRRKREEQRRKTIDEILTTESDFLRSISTCYDVFFYEGDRTVERPPSVDLDLLFGNMNEVIELSQRFYNLLEAATSGKEFHEQTIGDCFEEIGGEMKRVLGIYCRNHDEVINALTKLESNTEAQAYFRDRLEVIRSRVMAFDLAAILIKPVQRILKYPLLIGELVKSTEEDHPDFVHLRAADVITREVAQHINEYKRRKDLVFKYKRPEEGGIGRKISKLSVHSIRKKINRFMTPAQSQDEIFLLEENKFKEMSLAVKNFARDVGHHLDGLQVSHMDLETFSAEVVDHFRDNQTFKRDLLNMGEAYSRISDRVRKEFKNRVESDILSVLNGLLHVYQGPREVIKKRHHKLLDFHNALGKFGSLPEGERTKGMKEELEILKRTYEAMNVQLLEDLPKLSLLSASVMEDSVRLLAKYQLEFIFQARRELQNVLEMDLFLPSQSTSSSSSTCQEIMNEFMMHHLKMVDQLSEMSFIPQSFNPTVGRSGPDRKGEERSRRSLQPQLSRPASHGHSEPLRVQSLDERSQVVESFDPEKLYVVSEDFRGGQMLDLPVLAGTVVGVIKEEDPMKNRERFFVFDGAEKGFVLKSYLKRYESENSKEASGKPSDLVDLIDFFDDLYAD